MNEVEQELIGTALPYWEAEATIVRRFFRSKPAREDHIFWLKAQLWKELHPVDGYFTGLQKELSELVASFSEIDKTIDRHRYHSLLEQLIQEFNHYVLMADVLEYLLGHPVSATDTFQLPQEKKLGELRRSFATSGSPIDKAAVLVRRLSDAPAEEWHRLRYHALMDAGQLGARNLSVTWVEIPAGAEQTLRSDEGGEQVYVVVRGSGSMSVAGDTQRVAEGDLILVPPATDHSIANDGDDSFACVSVQSPPVTVAEIFGGQMAEVTGYDDDEDL